MATNGSGNGFSSFDALFERARIGGSLDEQDVCDRRTGELVALRVAFRALLRTGYLDEIAEELADGFSEGKRDHQLALVAKAEGAGPRAILRYRAFMTATDDIIEKLRAAGRRA